MGLFSRDGADVYELSDEDELVQAEDSADVRQIDSAPQPEPERDEE